MTTAVPVVCSRDKHYKYTAMYAYKSIYEWQASSPCAGYVNTHESFNPNDK